MIKLLGSAVWKDGGFVPCILPEAQAQAGRQKTMAYSIMNGHNSGGDSSVMRLRFDSLISHDITYVGVIQTAKAS